MSDAADGTTLPLHRFIDWHYGADGDDVLERRLAAGEDANGRADGETPLHVAARRRRERAVAILLDHGAEIDAVNAHGKTAWVHAARRGFGEIARLLESRGADTTMSRADRFAVAVTSGRLDEARAMLATDPGVARTGNPEEDRLLADVAGRGPTEPVELLIAAGADLAAPALDGGTPLHQAAWFGQPANARLLVEAGAPLDVFDPSHRGSPLAWATHGSRFSGGAADRQDDYVEIVRLLLGAGTSLRYPGDPDGGAYRRRLLEEASPAVRRVLEGAG